MLAFPTAVFLDDAGDGWVAGSTQTSSLYRGLEYYSIDGAWFAFRRAGGAFGPVVKLRGTGPVWISGNAAGKVLLAWRAAHGSYVAWGSPSGRLSKPRFFGGGFEVSGLGVDEHGRGLLVGYYPAAHDEAGARTIVSIAANGAGHFARAHVLAVIPRYGPRHRLGILYPPLLGTGPTGAGVIAWQAEPAPSGRPRITLVYLQADGRYGRPVRLPSILGFPNDDVATVDSAGRALILSVNNGTPREIAVAPGGKLGPVQRLSPSHTVYEASLVGNAAGQTAITWSIGFSGSLISAVLGDTGGANSALQALPGTHRASGAEDIATIDAQGNTTLLWAEETAATNAVMAQEVGSSTTAVRVGP
jgi:hypothetical protein